MKSKIITFIILLFIMSGCSDNITAKNELHVQSDKHIIIDNISFTINKMDTRKEIKPEKPSGYYHYYEENDGYLYYVITGTAKNDGPYNLNTENILVQGKGKKTYEGKLFFSNSEESDFIKEIKSKESLKFYVAILVKDGMSLPNEIKVYYTNDFQPLHNSSSYDNVLIWTLPVS